MLLRHDSNGNSDYLADLVRLLYQADRYKTLAKIPYPNVITP